VISMRWINLYRILANILMDKIKLRLVTICLADCQRARLLQVCGYSRTEINDVNEKRQPPAGGRDYFFSMGTTSRSTFSSLIAWRAAETSRLQTS
jgi:hypothetical protein